MKSNDDTIFSLRKGLVQLSDQSEIYKLIDKVLSDRTVMVDDYKNSKDKLFGFFIGQIMKISKGKQIKDCKRITINEVKE